MPASRSKPFTAANPAAISRRRACALLLGAPPCVLQVQAADEVDRPLRLAISESLVSAVNLNDARAAMVVWIQRISKEMGLPVEYIPRVFDSTQQIVTRVRAGQFDAVALNVLEYSQVAAFLDVSRIIVSNEGAPLQYVILANRDSGIQTLRDLKGGRMIRQAHSTACLAPTWLSTLLAEQRLGEAENFFGAVTTVDNANRVILPVFFGQAEAGLTTNYNFLTASELNPQVAKRLKVLNISPELVATFYAFRKGYHGPLRQKLMGALSGISRSAAGQQLMTMFQFRGLAERDGSCLAGALGVLETARRLAVKPLAGKGEG